MNRETDFVVLARGLGPAAYGVYALAWRITQPCSRLVTFGSVPARTGDPRVSPSRSERRHFIRAGA
ncbi:hypothetical protein [Halorubrum amylolyticum]|uniref:hypothetical protein n=1 Tax=Halorubrum amylolyticum TaxID=2508724 RepID=UPI001008E8C9|nr:hypothetical protein [Halorubrum amylolyticum]